MFVTVTKGEMSSHFSSLWGRFKPKNFLKILVECVGQFRYGPLFHDMHIATFSSKSKLSVQFTFRRTVGQMVKKVFDPLSL